MLGCGECGDTRGGTETNLAAERFGEKAADDLRRHVAATIMLVIAMGGYIICREHMKSWVVNMNEWIL
jgi:hypothetical protein